VLRCQSEVLRSVKVPVGSVKVLVGGVKVLAGGVQECRRCSGVLEVFRSVRGVQEC